MPHIVRIVSIVAPLLASVFGCTPAMLGVHNPTAAPSSSSEATTESAESDPPDATPTAKHKSSADADPMQDRQVAIGDAQFTVTLPCAPVADKADKDDSPLGPVLTQTYTCNDDATDLDFFILAVKFSKPLKAGADPTHNTTAAAKWLGHEMCDINKAKKCDIPGTLILTSATADFELSFPGKDPETLRVAARYPIAVALTVAGDATTDAAKRVLRSIKIAAQP